jgi:hypothetical protein
MGWTDISLYVNRAGILVKVREVLAEEEGEDGRDATCRVSTWL